MSDALDLRVGGEVEVKYEVVLNGRYVGTQWIHATIVGLDQSTPTVRYINGATKTLNPHTRGLAWRYIG